MALNTRGAIDPRWTSHNRGVLRALQLATVEVFNQASSTKVYDAVTNTWTGDDATLYSGPARVQPLNSVSETAENYNPTFLKNVRVQIAASAVDIRPNDRLCVTACATNQTLTKFVYVVTDVLNSSNAWEKTLLCRVDTELDPTVV